MRRVVLSVLVATTGLTAASGHAEPTRPKRHASSKRKRATAPPAPTPRTAAPEKVPPGAQLTPNRVIEAPRAPGPDSSPGRVAVPAREVAPKRDADRDVQPPYPTGPDPGRNMQPATGLSPSSQSVVP